MSQANNPAVAVSHDGLRLLITINGLLHAHVLDTEDLFAVKSWHVANKYFAIELISMTGAKLLLDYDQRDIWEAVLRGLATAFGDGMQDTIDWQMQMLRPK